MSMPGDMLRGERGADGRSPTAATTPSDASWLTRSPAPLPLPFCGAQRCVAASLAAELRELEGAIVTSAACRMLQVRGGAVMAMLWRYWKHWAVCSSLPLREARAAQQQLELAAHQERQSSQQSQQQSQRQRQC